MKNIVRIIPLIVLGVFLASCEKPIEGELKLLLDSVGVLSPCWAPDGKMIYYLISYAQGEWGELRAINIETLETKSITLDTQQISPFDLSPDGSTICFSGSGWWHTRLYFMNAQDGQITDSLVVDSIRYNSPPRYSRQSPDVIYYLSEQNKLLSFHRLKRTENKDEIIINLSLPEHTPCFGVSSNDSFVVIGKTIYSLIGNDSIPLDLELTSLDWHPTNLELFVAVAGDDKLFFYDLKEGKWSKAKADPYNPSRNSEARFSPDGTKVIFTSIAKEGEWADYAMWLFTLSN